MTISKQRLKAISAIRDEAIDYSDVPELDEEFWQNAKLKMPEQKSGVYVRLDSDVLTWLKAQGKGYHARINAILRSYYEAHRDSSNSK